MWSFAVLLWELVTREVPFADLSNMEIGMKVALEGLRPTIPPGISPHICKLMEDLHERGPSQAAQIRYDRPHSGEDAGQVTGSIDDPRANHCCLNLLLHPMQATIT
ncbi:integrin-linked protein kinase [Huso huso]|uniref:Integrin-linked protein kinase n=1 Tax=Huso huso TaxID=61971 RepID=A0ABR0ZLT9_HUSHU